MALQSPEIVQCDPSNDVAAPLVLIPFRVSIVDDLLSKVSSLETAANFVKVADTALGRGRDEDRPVE